MDFFAAQHRARRNSLWLMFVFLLSAAGVAVVMYCAVSLGMIVTDMVRTGGAFSVLYPSRSLPAFWDRGRFFGITLVTVGCIAAGAIYRTVQLSRHGAAL